MALLHMAGRRFPVIGLVCPSEEGEVICPVDGEGRRGDLGWWYQRSLGGDGSGWYVPCENGLLIDVGNNIDQETVTVSLYSRHCRLNHQPCGCAIWLPTSMGIHHGRLVPNEQPMDMPGTWYRAEPEWAVELIDRVSVMPVDEPDGPLAALLSVEALRDEQSKG